MGYTKICVNGDGCKMGAMGVYSCITIEDVRQNLLCFVYNVTQSSQTLLVCLMIVWCTFYVSILNWLFVVRRVVEYRACYYEIASSDES